MSVMAFRRDPATALDLLLGGSLRHRFQPIFTVLDGGARLHSVECLSRGPRGTWREEAARLFDEVRRQGLEVEMDRCCAASALAEMAQCPPPAEISLAVNVHAVTLCQDPGFASFLAREAESHGIAAERLIVEVIEYAGLAAAAEDEPLLRELAELRDLGVKVAVNDVGRRVADLERILEFQPDFLKLDRRLVQRIAVHPFRAIMIEALVGLADRLGAFLVAEGVERRDDLEALRGLGVEIFQGYLLAAPMGLPELARLPFYRRPVAAVREISVA
jgi:EAL domain-containing protein (putative c-di-GMP-specific phosphodiesterase class I)